MYIVRCDEWSRIPIMKKRKLKKAVSKFFDVRNFGSKEFAEFLKILIKITYEEEGPEPLVKGDTVFALPKKKKSSGVYLLAVAGRKIVRDLKIEENTVLVCEGKEPPRPLKSDEKILGRVIGWIHHLPIPEEKNGS